MTKVNNAKYGFKSLVQVKTSASFKNIALFLVCLFVLAIVSLFVAPWQQYSTGIGKVIAYAPDERLQVISSPVEGRISKWFIAEGRKVKAGDPIVQLSDLDPQILDRLRSELEAALQRMQAAKQAAELSEVNLERQKMLAEKGLSSQRTFELAQIEYSKMLSELSNATAELARVEVRFSRQASQVVVAPADGIIQRIFGASGGVVVKPGDPVATLAPYNNSNAVELLVDGNDVPLIQTGRKVRLQFEGWPAVQVLGWPSLAVGTFGGKVAVIDPADDGSGRFRLIVFPDEEEPAWPDGQFLRLGVRTQGWVLLDRVQLWFEIWRRFNGFPKSAEKSLSVSNFNPEEYRSKP